MAVIKQGGGNPHAGKVMTTRGPRDPDRRLCYGCGEYKTDGLFTVNANGKTVCPDCATSTARKPLRADCEDGVCVCIEREPEDGKLDEPELPDD